jgi:hypothetical protein
MGVDQTERRAKPAFKTRKRDQIAHQMPEPWQTVPKRLDTCATQLQHGREDIPLGECRLKAMCILQELDLTKRCIEAGIPVYSSTSVRKRDYLLTLLYNLQNRFL